jgi:predicted nuclease with TOPRIM domain
MDDTQKMLKALIKGQADLSNKIDNIKLKLSVNIDNVYREVQDLRTETKDGFKKVNDRIDTLGKSLAYLEDDAPTRDEFDILETRVEKIEHILVTG